MSPAPSTQEQRERVALERVAEAARNMPRRTPAPGGCSTEHDFKISAGTVWVLDKALRELEAALASPPAPGAIADIKQGIGGDTQAGLDGLGRLREGAESEASFQTRVHPWLVECFGSIGMEDREHRADRMAEEFMELLQAVDYPEERFQAVYRYVMGRPKGEPGQEVGGSMMTLAAFCIAHSLDMHEEGERELARVNRPEVIVKIRAKEAAKPKGSALPGYALSAQPGTGAGDTLRISSNPSAPLVAGVEETETKRFGYAPGTYEFICLRCNDVDIGDKRAVHCRDCANILSALKAHPTIDGGDVEPADREGRS